MKSKQAIAWPGRMALALFSILACGPAFAGSTPLPSAPGPKLDRISDLGNDSWLALGQPSPDARWGQARGRKWTSKMAYAEDLGGAFLFGEGKHGWVDPESGRYMDDLWFYDAMKHRWLNLHPGFNTIKPPKISLNTDGFPSVEGEPLPIATMVHGYDQTTWNPDTKEFMSMPARGGYWKQALPSLLELMTNNEGLFNHSHASPWFFDMLERRWSRKRTNMPSPTSGFGMTFVYSPLHRKAIFRGKKNSMWSYDADDNRWTRLNPKGPPPPFGIDANSCLDAKRGRLYIGGGKYPVASGPSALWLYDIAADTWINPMPKGSPGSNTFGTNEALLHCDQKNDVVVLFRHKGPDRGVHVYSPVSNSWQTMPSRLPAAWADIKPRGALSGFYDISLNAHFVFVAGDSHNNGRFFVYRYRQPRR